MYAILTWPSRRAARLSAPLYVAFFCAVASADPVLEAYDASLTTYLPGAATRVQDVWPRPEQRGVGLDGSMVSPSAFAWALAGNPMADGWSAQRRFNGVDLATGSYAPTDIDLSLPAPGFRRSVGRSYNSRQWDGSAYRVSDGYQGKNWFQLSQPELKFYDDSDNTKDVVYIVYGADRYLEFNRTGSTSTVFKGKNGAAGVVQYASGSPDTWVYYDQHGTKSTFFGGNTSSNRGDWQLWKIEDPAGNVAYAGDKTTASTAVTSGFDLSGRITTAYDTADRRYTYTYSSVGGGTHLTQVKAETRSGSSWSSPGTVTEVGRVEYDYYASGGTTYGDAGNLKLVTVTTPLTDSGVSSVHKTLYRYWTTSGKQYCVQYVVNPEGYRRADYAGDATFDDDPLTMSEGDLSPYAALYFAYDSGSNRQIVTARVNGSCGCGGGSGSGEYTLAYEPNSSYSNTTGYTTDSSSGFGLWSARVKIAYPTTDAGTAYRVQYIDEVGQTLDNVMSDRSPTASGVQSFVTSVDRDSGGVVSHIHTPDNLSAYAYASGSMSRTFGTDSGLIKTRTLAATGDTAGFPTEWMSQNGMDDTTPPLERSVAYTTAGLTVGSASVARPFLSAQNSYFGTGGSDYDATSTSYTFYGSGAALMPKQLTTTNPVVSSSTHNGSGSATTASVYLRKDGTAAFTQSASGVFTYSQYSGGQLVKSIRDAQTSSTTDFASGDDPNGDFGITESGTGLRYVTSYTYDAQGRLDTTTMPDGDVTKMYYSRLADERLITIGIPKVSGSTFYGPASYAVTNLAGKAEAQGTIAISGGTTTTALTAWISESSADPIAAVGVGSLARLSTSIYDAASGTQLNESRGYFSIPGSGAGSAGTNYDATTYGYDAVGRVVRTKGPSGTIGRSVLDAIGRTKERWTGTNDHSFTGGEASGTDDMVRVELIEFNDPSSTQGGNSLVSRRTLYSDASTTQGVTAYTYDFRGRLLVQENPTAPHALNKYDNLGRLIAAAEYDNPPSAADDPTATTASHRRALSETLYDERGQVWKSVRHKVNQSSGAKEDTLETLNWYDPDGRLIKTVGERLSKTRYDRLGRVTHLFVLAKDNDTTYANVYTSGQTDVGGDSVLEEAQTTYDTANASDDVLMRATINRDYGDTGGTGALDSNADASALKYTAADLSGRIQITAMWYDSLHRLTDSASYGTNNGSDLDRSGLSVPSRSDTVLVASHAYSDDGTLRDTTDPRGLVARRLYDAAGRTTATIANYTGGSVSSSTRDNDVYTGFGYTNGLMTKRWVDTNGNGSRDSGEDQTIYTYGVAKGASYPSSKIGSGALLSTVQYPDSSGGSDVVTYAYNAQRQMIYVKDQAGNEFEYTLDARGRQVHRKATTIASGFDDAVKRMSTAYDALGRASTVTQFSTTTVGSPDTTGVVDQVQYSYDGWGDVSTFAQDRDGLVGASGSVNDYEVQYTYEKAAGGGSGGRSTVRRTYAKLYYTTTELARMEYDYLSSGSLLDDAASRVSRVRVGATPVTVATYDYLGSGGLVGTTYPEISVMSKQYGSSGGYPDLDRFGRVVTSRWTKDLATDLDFYKVNIEYDRDSNVAVAEDTVFGDRWSALYAYDGLNRLTAADRGQLNSGHTAMSTLSQHEEWTTLSQTGNWNRRKLDLDGDAGYSGGGELDDTSTFNAANELTARDTDTNGTNNCTLSSDAAGNLTDDGQSYKYVYDAFGRLRQIKNQSGTLVEEFTYNGLGYRIGWHYDVDTDGTVESTSDDPWYYFAYDDRWRMVATFRGADTDAKELFVNHMAGPNGVGASSRLDDVILCDKDANSGWSAACDGTREGRVYYCQNWRGDVVALVGSDGKLRERVFYSAYGVPFGSPRGDANGDGTVSYADITQTFTDWGSPGAARSDLNLDGSVGSADQTVVWANWGITLGRGALSVDLASGGFANRKGYAGYEHDGVIDTLCHVRNRSLLTDLGRWTRRDPLGYVDGMGLYGYTGDRPLVASDPFGLRTDRPAGKGLFDHFAEVVVDEPSNGSTCSETPWCPRPGGGPCYVAGCGGTCVMSRTIRLGCDTTTVTLSSLDGTGCPTGDDLTKLLEGMLQGVVEACRNQADCTVDKPVLSCPSVNCVCQRRLPIQDDAHFRPFIAPVTGVSELTIGDCTIKLHWSRQDQGFEYGGECVEPGVARATRASSVFDLARGERR